MKTVGKDSKISYEQVLADLKAKRDVLDKAIAGIEQIVGQVNTLSAFPGSHAITSVTAKEAPATSTLESDTFHSLTTAEAAKRFLQMMKRPQPTGDIARALEQGGLLHKSQNFYNTVWTVLRRGVKEGEFEKVGKNWGLPEWYANSGKRKKD